MIAVGVLACVAWLYLLGFHGRFWSAGPVLPAARGTEWPAVTVVVPARNEAETVVAVLRSLLAQVYAGEFRVVLVDDCSTDTTAALARSLADPRLDVVSGAVRPAGWSGKLWALQQGIATAASPLLLLTDADIEHAPDHLAALVSRLVGDRLVLVSEMVALNCSSAAERWLVPAFVFFFQLLYPFAWVNQPGRRMAAAAGGTMLVRADALAGIGGLAALRGALIDDVTLATRLKRAGGALWLGHSTRAWSRRPYPRAGDVWRMVARTAFVQLRYSWVILVLCTLGMALVWLAGPALAMFGRGAARWLGFGAWFAASLSYLPTLHRFRLSAARAPFLPLVALFYMAATVGSALDHVRGGGVRWKGRAYAERSPEQTVR